MMTIKVSTQRGVYGSITGADVNDIVVFFSSDEKNRNLPKKVKVDHPYRIVSVDEQGWTRFMKSAKHTCISGCEPNQIGRYTIVARNVS
jgi:hypothetical protein